MAGFGLIVAIVLYALTGSKKLAGGAFFFFTMEFLQGVQYWVINRCQDPWNVWLTAAGLLHILSQPVVCFWFWDAFAETPYERNAFKVSRILCVLGAIWFLLRAALRDWAKVPPSAACPNTEWLRGREMCTFSGEMHLAWSVALHDVTYFMPGTSLHLFLMVAPYFAAGKRFWLPGIAVLLTGPVLASYITPNLHEQASIWCFFSSCQVVMCTVMLFLSGGVVNDGYASRRPAVAAAGSKKLKSK